MQTLPNSDIHFIQHIYMQSERIGSPLQYESLHGLGADTKMQQFDSKRSEEQQIHKNHKSHLAENQ